MPMAIEMITSGEIEPNVLRNPGPLALDFYGDSCPPCRTLEPRLERIAERYEGRLPVYRVDAERNLPVAESFGVSSLPTVLIFRDGEEVERLDGLIREENLAAAFDRATIASSP
jgi:thioredoxin 1